ncbi:tRNA dihydrouridine synthase DusB [Methylobacterium sp. J-068]|uniref:tRNA dihydrouridine synthase DusB n=1 Tax=Methylobacterium sp. J-068 TaxID=2836649 RepID=UPI001FBA48DB|nr:tRNA dihydrouridine synthase DusB [Methylobacterium sp. J-068]MCJ2033677.1 tRNA dihydrouridine synthase DusB [Methylobacterium sp. J-068]
MWPDDYLSVLRSPEISGDPAALGTGRPVPVLLAPLSGVTDLHVRRIARRLGASAVVSEMVAAAELARGDAEARLRAEGSGVDPHIVQLAGCAPEPMAEAARIAEANGADVIDINMGCPAKVVTGVASGSALMRDIEGATRILAAVRGAVRVPVTVKMRLGWDHATLNASELARRSEGLGLNAVTVHGRTRQQFYKDHADWDAIRAVVEAVAIPVIANGDVGTPDQARTCLARSGAAGLMIGRAALGRPWLVGAIAADLAGRPAPALTAADKAAVAVEHYQGLLALYGLRMGVRHARKHLAAYAEVGGGLSGEQRMRLLTTTDPAVAVDLLTRAFAASGDEAAQRMIGEAA